MNFSKKRIAFLFLLLSFCCPCFAFKTLSIHGDYIYEMYEPQDKIPSEVLEEGLLMYFETYLNPKLHDGISLKTLQLDESRFQSYEEFIFDMFQRDFESYQCEGVSCNYLQVRHAQDNKIIGLCVILEQNQKEHYYIDHIGVHKDFRCQGIAQTLIREVINFFSNFKEISLDTRIFNTPAQSLYEKLGFKNLEVHPNPAKQLTYYYYVLYPEKSNFFE